MNTSAIDSKETFLFDTDNVLANPTTHKKGVNSNGENPGESHGRICKE
jgi:hypothetical protein